MHNFGLKSLISLLLKKQLPLCNVAFLMSTLLPEDTFDARVCIMLRLSRTFSLHRPSAKKSPPCMLLLPRDATHRGLCFPTLSDCRHLMQFSRGPCSINFSRLQVEKGRTPHDSLHDFYSSQKHEADMKHNALKPCAPRTKGMMA